MLDLKEKIDLMELRDGPSLAQPDHPHPPRLFTIFSHCDSHPIQSSFAQVHKILIFHLSPLSSSSVVSILSFRLGDIVPADWLFMIHASHITQIIQMIFVAIPLFP